MSKFSLRTGTQINESSPSATAVTRLISPQTLMLAGLCAMYVIAYIDRVIYLRQRRSCRKISH